MANTSASTLTIHTSTGTAGVVAVSGGRALGFNDAKPPELPLFTAAGYASAPVNIPLWVADGQATVGVTGWSHEAMFMLSLWDAQGTAASSTDGFLRIGAATIRLWTSRGTGTDEQIGSSAVVMPRFVASGRGNTSSLGVSDVTWPIFYAEGTAIAAAASSYASLALNTRRRGQTSIEGWAFNSMGVLNGMRLALTDTALVEITGDDDDGEPIVAHLTTHVADQGADKKKRALDMLVGYRCDGDMELTVTVNEHDSHIYVLERPGHEELSNGRVKIGKGMSGRYWQFDLANTDGCDFELDTMAVNMVELSRRVP